MTVIVSDSFNRADSTSLGSTDNYNGGTSKAWSIAQGGATNFQIKSNQLWNSVATQTHAVVDSGISDASVSVTVESYTTGSNQNSVTFRFTGTSAYFWFFTDTSANAIKIYRTNGSSTIIASTTPSAAGVSLTAPYTMKASFNGSTITCYINDVQVLTVTDTFNQTATKHGIQNWSGNTYFDNFQIEDFSSGGYVTQTPNASTADGIATTSDAGVIGQQSTSGAANGSASTNNTTPITLQQANPGPANGTSTGADFTSGAQGANAGQANGQASTADAVPIRIQIANAGAANGASSSSDTQPILKQQAQAGTAAGTANTAWVVPRTGVDIQPDMFKILH